MSDGTIDPDIMRRLLAKARSPEDEPQDEQPEQEDPRVVAADELLQAISHRDPEALVAAFETLSEACAEGHSAGGEIGKDARAPADRIGRGPRYRR